MSRREAPSEVSVQSLLDSAKELPEQPAAVRERVLSRARMTAAAPLPVVTAPAPHPRFSPQLAAAGAAAVVGGLVGSVLALGGSWPAHPPAPPALAVGSQPVAAPLAVPNPVALPAPVPVPAGVAAEPPRRAAPGKARREEAQESYNAELELMRSAHTAYASRDFTSALVLVGEHARRFPGGLLTEEREALRVRCLLGAGRRSQARVAADSFAARFPRSVLSRRLQIEVGATAE
jgi:hypothetical protein